MSSNENDAVRRNDLLSEANILICYMRKSELRVQSYGMMKNANKLGFRGKSTLRDPDPDPDLELTFIPQTLIICIFHHVISPHP